MSEAALYRALVIAKVPEDVAEKAVEGLAQAHEVTTRADLAELRTELFTRIAEHKVDLMRWQMINTAVIIAVIGLMMKFF